MRAVQCLLFYKGKADSIIELFKQANSKLDHIINPEAASKDTTPPGDKVSEMANKEDVDISKNMPNATTSHYSAIINKSKKNLYQMRKGLKC